jgi:putative transposase
VWVHEATLSDEAAAWWVPVVCAALPRLQRRWADGAYRGWLAAARPRACGVTLQRVSTLPGQVGVVLEPRRWVVERTGAWFGRNRRLAKADEEVPACSESWR